MLNNGMLRKLNRYLVRYVPEYRRCVVCVVLCSELRCSIPPTTFYFFIFKDRLMVCPCALPFSAKYF
jgi:hypothetical protein